MCVTLTEFLRSSGYSCESTTDPVEALAILGRGNFELAISDINMPRMDGLKLVNEISKVDPGVDTIMITGHTGIYTYSDIIRAGAADFIAKPFQLPELKAKMERIDRERKMQSELQEMNAGLRVLLQGLEREKLNLRADVTANLKELIFPYLEKLKVSHLNAEQCKCLEILESNLADICSPFINEVYLSDSASRE
jgi:DNA-binding NtrC family response regulator